MSINCRSKNQSSKQWLDYHGLAAKKLTILDALSPTFIPHKPKYIPILDKHVLSKVFDDVSSRDSNTLRSKYALTTDQMAGNFQDYG